MTDASTDPSAGPSAGPSGDRYGRPARWQRRAVVVGSGLVGVLALSWVAWTTFFHATPDVSSQIVGWEVVDDHAVIVQIDVDLRGEADTREVTCAVRASAADHTVVGEVSFSPEDGRNEVAVRTERRATSVESVGCTTPDQPRPR